MDDLDTVLDTASAHGGRTACRPTSAQRPGIRLASFSRPEDDLVELLQPACWTLASHGR
ncbi:MULTISPECIES: hypothetical protein [unclassified Streptomyces]|uniref:hypothetical protein n=1 Tax=unclassified Streptomyces TaxID=2593676 RepID=UPI00344CE213